MEQEVKLLQGTSLEGEDQQFYIYRNSKLGEGGFGVVRKAFQGKNNGRPLAVKIIPYGGDETKRVKIQREVAILRVLPDHPNLVRVLPYKCFSENNFYIFMELCGDGTLTDVVRKQGLLQQESIFSIFYQLLSGYRVLWQAKIVHQDLKLANVLIKNGVLKITDFGFSIFAQKYVSSLTRQGTLHYMPYQKLTDPQYVADELSDVYSLGVMMFEVITKMHPYINQKSIKTQKEYVAALRAANIARPRLYSTYTVQLQNLFELVMKMCAKLRKNRVGCKQIYQYLDSDQIFQPFRERGVEPSVELQLAPLQIKIQEISSPIFLPFVVDPENEKEYIKKLNEEKDNKISEFNRKLIEKVKLWVLGKRLILYYFDRLGRRLMIQKSKQGLTGEIAHSYNKAILSCLTFQKRISKDILKEIKNPVIFKPEEIQSFRKSEQGKLCLKIVRKDEQYTQQSVNDHLKRTIQVQAKEQKELIDLSEKVQIAHYLAKAQKNILDCADKRALNISDKKQLVTLVYLLKGVDLLNTISEVDGIELQGFFYKIQTDSVNNLMEVALKEMEGKNLPKPMFLLDDSEEDQFV